MSERVLIGHRVRALHHNVFGTVDEIQGFGLTHHVQWDDGAASWMRSADLAIVTKEQAREVAKLVTAANLAWAFREASR